MASLTSDQKQALQFLYSWINNPNASHITMGGYAGTGKTTIIALLRKILHQKSPKTKVALVSFTGKASQVLKSKLISAKQIHKHDHIGTIHSLLYTPNVNSSGSVTSWNKNKSLKHDLIIIDEASMVTSEVWSDLRSFNLPIIAIGDHGQLPPVGDNFNLLETPDFSLETIHRQAQDNPIIALATMARESGKIPLNKYSNQVQKIARNSPVGQELIERYFYFNAPTDEVLVLCARNKTRIDLNNHLRGLLGIENQEPTKGDKVICLRNNYNATGGPVFNGMIGTIDSISHKPEHWFQTQINFNDRQTYSGNISSYQFNNHQLVSQIKGLNYKQIGDRFDFGYALTVHKAQGSQAKTVILFEEQIPKWTDEETKRWLYTAITRAQEELYILA